MKIEFRSVLFASLSCLFFPAAVQATVKVYLESGCRDVPDSWLPPEFSRQWELRENNVQYAYAPRYISESITIGIFDKSVFPYPDFDGKLNKNEEDNFYNVSGILTFLQCGHFVFSGHGAHVAGIAVEARNDQGMYGVLYNTGINSNSYYFETQRQSNAGIYNISWNSFISIHNNNDDQPIFLSDGRPFCVQFTKEDPLNALSAADITVINKLIQNSILLSNMNSLNKQYAALLRAAHAEKLIADAAENYKKYAAADDWRQGEGPPTATAPPVTAAIGPRSTATTTIWRRTPISSSGRDGIARG